MLETLPCFLSGGHKRQHDQTLLTTVHSSSKHHKKKLACEGYFLHHLFSRSLSLTRLQLDLERLKLSGIPLSSHVTISCIKSREIRCSILPTSQKTTTNTHCCCSMSTLKPTQNQVSSSPKLSRWVQLEVVRPKVTNFKLKKKKQNRKLKSGTKTFSFQFELKFYLFKVKIAGPLDLYVKAGSDVVLR